MMKKFCCCWYQSVLLWVQIACGNRVTCLKLHNIWKLANKNKTCMLVFFLKYTILHITCPVWVSWKNYTKALVLFDFSKKKITMSIPWRTIMFNIFFFANKTMVYFDQIMVCTDPPHITNFAEIILVYRILNDFSRCMQFYHTRCKIHDGRPW